jgi:hypothetical protein
MCTQISERVWQDDYGHLIVNTHISAECARNSCPLHNPSNHSMVDFPQRWRPDRHLMERMCPHGIGHPDPDDLSLNRVHGCDGCCTPGGIDEL